MSQKIEIINNWTLPRIFQELEIGNMNAEAFSQIKSGRITFE